jgi:hypothetical protein
MYAPLSFYKKSDGQGLLPLRRFLYLVDAQGVMRRCLHMLHCPR